MADEAVNDFLGRGGDRATRSFLKATKGIENAEVATGAPDDAGDASGSVFDGLGDVLEGIMQKVGEVVTGQSQMQQDYAQGVSDAVGDVGSAIANHYNNTAYHEILDSITDDDGNITPESAAAAENGGNAYDATADDSVEQFSTQYEDPDSFGAHLRNDLNEWGDTFYQDVSALASGIADELTATSLQDFQAQDDANAERAWQAYEDVARPAGMIAVTPGLPAPVRAGAGLVYAPKFLSDAANMYQGTPGEDGENEGGGIAGIVHGMVTQPLEQLLTDVTHPGQLLADIHEHPANLWDRVLMPATMVEGGVRGGARAKRAVDGRYRSAMDALSEMEDDTSALSRDASLADVDVTPGESSSVPFADTGHGQLDEWMADAADQYGVDLNILHKMAQQESEHGRADTNVMQVLDSTGAELGFEDVSDPRQSVYAGAAYLRKMLDKDNGDYAAAIRDYNGGGDPEYLEHVLSQPDYDVSGTRPGGAEGGYDVPAEAAYTLEPGVNHEGFSDLTEQKLRVLDAYYAELTGGDHLDVTSMRDGTHSDPGHANGTAFDVANDALHDDALRAKVIAKAEELGLRAYDEFDRSNWTENTTGDNLHLSDTGSALEARSGSIGRDAWAESQRPAEDAEMPSELVDVTGEPVSAGDDLHSSIERDVQEMVDASDLPRAEDVNAPAKVNWGEERTEDVASLDRMIAAAEDERQRMIDDEVRRMEETPGGRGTETGYTYDADGNVVGRFSTSRNPQWYQDAYERLGRAPRKSDLPMLAEENLAKEREFAELDGQLQQLKEVRSRLTEHPEADGRSIVTAVTSRDGLVYGEKSGSGKMQVVRRTSKPMSERAIAGNIQRGNEAVEHLIREHAAGRDTTVHGAMHRPDVGYIDFPWGTPGKGAKFKKGFGLAHILAKHGAESGKGVIHKIVETIAKGTEIEEQHYPNPANEYRIKIHYQGHTAVLSSQSVKGNAWLLTGWEDGIKKEASTRAAGEVYGSARATADAPMRTRRTGGEDTSSNSNIPRTSAKVNENPLVHKESNSPVQLAPGERPSPIPDREGRMPEARLGEKKPQGHFKGERVTRDEILTRAKDLFGTIRTGRTGRGLNGLYNAGSDVARTAQYGQFETLWHEVGHKVDSLLGLTEKAGRRFDGEFLAVLNRKYKDGFLNHYRADELQPEGIAEFMKEYMMSPVRAERDFPTFARFWQEEVGKNKDLSARVQEMREMMEVHETQPEGAQMLADIRTEQPKTLKQRIGEWMDKTFSVWADDKWGIKRAEEAVEKVIGRKLSYDESAYIYARIAKDAGASRAQQLLTSTDARATTKALNRIYGGVLKHDVTFPQVIEKIQSLEKSAEGKRYLSEQGFEDGQEALKAYLVARRFMEVYDLKTRDGKEYQMPKSYAEYAHFVDGAPKLLRDAAQDVYDLNSNVLAIMHHEGMLSDKLYETLQREHRHYVSLARAFDEDAALPGFGAESFINVGNGIQRLTEEGSVRDVIDPLQTIPKQVAASLIAVERNRVGQKFVQHSQFYGAGGVVERVPGTARAKDSSFRVWENGEEHVYNTTPEIYQALKSLKPDGIDSLIKVMAVMPARLMRAGAVIYNPAFLAKNLLRDQLTAFLYTEYGYRPFLDMARGMFHLLKRDDLYHEYVNSGALMSSIVSDGKTFAPELAKAYAKKGMRAKIFRAINPYTSLPALSEYIEQSTRMGLYAKARHKGASMIEATMEAREGTLDFGRAGTSGRTVNRYVPFFNAVIQDPVLFVEKCRRHPARMMKVGAAMAMFSIIPYALARSNDDWSREYDELMPYEKNMFWNIPVPKWVSKTGWVRYPKPFGPGFLFGSLPERMADYVYGYDKTGKGMKEWAKGFLEQFNPASLPPVIQAGLEWAANYSFFKERSIVPLKEQKLPNAQQYGNDTSEFAKRVGKLLDLSPRKIDNLGQNLMAGGYTSANAVLDSLAGKDRRVNPFGTLTVDPYRAPQSVQDFYDKLEEATKAYNGAKANGKPSQKQTYNYKLMSKASKAMSEINKKEQQAKARGDTAQVDAMNRQRLKAAQQALKAYKR